MPFDPLRVGPVVCRHCRPERRSALTAARAVTSYAGPVRQAILRYKFQRRRASLEALDWLLAEWLERGGEALAAVGLADADALVPVPLHWRRRLGRGFNQAEQIAAALGGHTGLPVWRALRRVRYTRPQVGLSPPERRRNVAGAFASNEQRDLTGTRLILIDDLYTTGATLCEAAGVLGAAGAARVTAVTIAQRVDRDREESRPPAEARTP